MNPIAPSTHSAPPYRTPATVTSWPQWRTVRRNGVKLRIPERNVRVIWLTGKIHIWRKRNLSDDGWTWRMRCDACVTNHKRLRVVASASFTWLGALLSAQRHARLYHNVQL